MDNVKNSTRISVLLARRLGRLAIAIGLLIALAAPSTYCIIENRAAREAARQSARQLADQFRGLILENPRLWKYQAEKYVELLHAYLPNRDILTIEIRDVAGRPITQYHYRSENPPGFIMRNLTQTGAAPIRFNNRVLGEVQVAVSSRHVIASTAIFFLLSLLLGLGIAYLAYRFPVSLVGKLEVENLGLTRALEKSNEQLEDKVKTRTAELGRANAALKRQMKARQRSQAALMEAHGHLEERVAARTADLTAANQQLRLEINSRRLTQEALGTSQEKLRFLSSKLLIVQEQERKRIALEIHDSLATTLSAIKFSVEKIRRDFGRGTAANIGLDNLISTIQLAIDECRRIMSGLHPSSLDELGLVATLEWFCQDFQQRCSHIAVGKRISIREEEIPREIKVVLYRLSQEAFHNVMQHSRATRVELNLTRENGGIEFSVADNGQGFDAGSDGTSPAPMGGLGILSMQERTENTGGAFTIDTSRGKGTTILARWPNSQNFTNSEYAA